MAATMGVSATTPTGAVERTDSVEDPDRDRQTLRRRTQAALASARAELSAAARRGRGGRAAQARYASQIDEIVRDLAAAAAREVAARVVVCAVGGYGRRLLCLHSDVDLLIVFQGAIGPAEERFANQLLQPLWDLRLTVGQHVSELADLETRDDDNPEFQMALCDLRLLIGDVRLFDEVLTRAHAGGARREVALSLKLQQLVQERHAEFNDTLYQLEPDLKNAPGALRDLGAIRLLRSLRRDAFMRVARPAGDRLEEAEEFLLRARAVLHLEAGRDTNILSHDQQDRVAEALGSAGSDTRERVEALMGEYFRHARTITRALVWSRRVVDPPADVVTTGLVSTDLELASDGVRFVDPGRAASKPALWIEAFQTGLTHGCAVSEQALAVIEEHAGRYTSEYFVASDADRTRLLALLRPTPGLSARLSEMLECGLLVVIFPEFEKIHSRVVRDFYHKYTVDEHTLLAIRHLESLWRPSSAGRARFGSILTEIHAPELLTLALLYHDIGKWQAEEHAPESTRLAQAMLTRLRLNPEERATVAFLIRHHLDMSQVAFRRDFGDPETVVAFANLVGSEERLKMLALLTLSDIEAVAPGTLTPFKEDLLWRLYVDTYNRLTMSYADELIQKDQLGRVVVLANRPTDIGEPELTRFLDGLPRRYLSVFGLATIYRHVRLTRGLGRDQIHILLDKHDDVWELTAAALDKPYLFSNICGVLAYFGMDIHRGQVMTTPDHIALDVVVFSDEEGFLRKNVEAREELERVLHATVAGTVDVRQLLRGRERSVLHRRRRVVETVVNIDNEHSARYTVVEIVTDDAPGLLHRISRAISDQACDVDLVLIATEGHKAIDVLHVTHGGHKLDEDAQHALTRELKTVLEVARETA
jgi:[protein-PII] uridylyltransferase